MSEQGPASIHEEKTAIPFSDFLETIPPGTLTKIADLTKKHYYQGGSLAGHEVISPEIQLHCPSDSCNGVRFFRRSSKSMPDLGDDGYNYFYVSYTCSNCRDYEKTFSLAAQRDDSKTSGVCYKFGELPEFGPPTPSRLIKLIGPDRELFLKGRRCENQGLGVGAFVYYRRVIEGQKNRILDEIIKVSQKLGAPVEQVTQLETAKKETQFSRALASVKDALPQSLLINGHNPLSLLHSALSDGLHARSDLAPGIRIP